ncbi:hypothetical protein IFM89_019068 [Coptis chinensis]|uniref:Uncharacterized protein n=1 Tax=Coptis chinensis TaxID=261450 RepID=A0A835MA25_9MAGN|nr:hypothetical protein IFM89_019068 [Coptis chinensis]
MLSVLRVHLPSDIPIVGCELTPYVLLQCPDTSITTDDVPESSPIDGFCLRYRWAASDVNENGTEEEELFGRFNTSGSGASNASLSSSTPKKKLHVGHANTILTSHVIPPPTPSPRRLVPVNGVDVMGNLDLDVIALLGPFLGPTVDKTYCGRLLDIVQTSFAFKRAY